MFRKNVLVYQLIALGSVAILVSGCAEAVTDAISTSHVEGNAPPPADFDQVLTKDLNSYFANSMQKPVAVKYELLRKQATQSGVAYPKYYAWVRIFQNNKLLDEGAVRLAAQDKVRFEVTNFVSKDSIKTNPSEIESVFPQLLCDRIRKLAAQPSEPQK